MKYVIPKNYIKIFGVFLATYLRFSEVLFTHFITKILLLLLKKKKPPKNLDIETELSLQFFNESTVRLLDFRRPFDRTHSGQLTVSDETKKSPKTSLRRPKMP